MSIIHDALKIDGKKSARRRLGVYRLQAGLVLLSFLFLFSVALYRHSHPVKKPFLVVGHHAVSQAGTSPLRLNGVFVSDRLKVAMINSHIYRKGESVNGMKITAIELNRVHLDRDGAELILKMS